MKEKRFKYSLSAAIVSAIIVSLLGFGIFLGIIGYISFTNTLKREYKTTTYHMTVAAKALVDVDSFDDYLEDKNLDDYALRYGYLHNYCNYMNVTLIHIFSLDQSDYLTGTNIFNAVNDKEIEAGNYTEWERGFVFGERYTANYKDVYEKVYTKQIEYGVVYRTKDLRGKEPHITIVAPLKDSNDNVVALACVQRPMSEIVNGRRPYTITMTVSTICLIFLISLSAFFSVKYRISKPINGVIDEVKYFSHTNMRRKDLNDFNYRLIEVEDLKVSVDKLETDMINYIQSLKEATVEKQKMGVELDIASQIQINSVPNEFPAFPNRKDFDIYAFMRPAKEVGGDFYNFFLIDETHLAMVMADVSGKGVPASLFMMVSNILLSEILKTGASPKDALALVNDRICDKNPLNMFVTIWVGILDLETGNVIASNAGHDNPIIYTNGKYELKKDTHGLVVGAMPGMEYTNYEFKINKGDKIFLYTDGIPEATNANNLLYSIDNLVEVLNNNKNSSCKETIDDVLDNVDRFVGDAPQFDDITMMAIEYKGN